MKEVTTNNRTLLFVEVPEDATELECRTAALAQYFDKDYNYIATTDTITEEQASELFGFKAITKDGKLYKYGLTASDGLPACASDKTGWVWSKFKSTVSEAVHTLLAEHSITGRHAIIEVL